jgi:hypothetical protein
MSDAAPSAKNCGYCLAPIQPGEAVETCPSCRAEYHRECWQENNGCAVYGCAQTPVTEGRRAIEVPVSYWGREHKPCPSCGKEILAAAVRCRHCGAQFSSARPQDSAEFAVQTALRDQQPAARREVITIFVFCVVPFLAPLGLVWALMWRPKNRDELAALPPLFGALSKIGLIAAIVLTGALTVMTALYAMLRA